MTKSTKRKAPSSRKSTSRKSSKRKTSSKKKSSRRTAAKKTTRKTSARKSSVKKKSSKKRSAAKKTTARKSKAKKPKASPKSHPAKRVAKKAAKKKVSAKNSTAKKRTAKKATGKKIVTKKKVTAKKSAVKKACKTKVQEPKPLTPAQQRKIEQERIDTIWKMFKKTGDGNLRNILVEYHFPLVKYIAERLLQTLPKSIELDDLISAGTFGLLDAIRGFDLSRRIKFKTYCSTRIRGSILDELRSQDWVPRLVRLKAHKLDRAMRRLEAIHGREANDYELAQELEITVDELGALKTEANARTIFSLSEKLEDGDDDRDMEKVEIIEDKRGCDPLSTLQQHDVLELITSNLTKKERLIIIMYYYEGLTMREIGDIMSLTESRVCQIHSNVMSRLKTQLKTLSAEERAVS